MTLADKLKNIQCELKAPKKQFNKFGNYKYRNCEDIMEAVKPVLSKYNCSLVVSDEVVEVGERYYIKATAMLIDTESDDRITTSAYAREAETKKGMDDSQITGASSSYARKYCLNGMFLIDDTKDADTTKTTRTATKKADEPEELTNLKKQIVSKCSELGGQSNEKVMAVVKKLGNPNALKTVEDAKTYLNELNKIG
jgi:hypothetical protein